MSRTVLTLKRPPGLRIDLRGITPTACAALGVAEVERLQVGMGNRYVALAELFDVSRAESAIEELHLEGDLSTCDRIGWQMEAGLLVARGNVGDHAGGCMRGGELRVQGDAGLLAACEMAGGVLDVAGSVGEFAASTLPGSMDGMRGGTFIVRGHAGARFADRMRRGTALVFGDVGDFVASRLVAGTVAIGGRCGIHPGHGMRRGSVVFAGAAPAVDPTFVPAQADAGVFWQLLARELARHGGPFAGLPQRRIERHLGDLGADGKGELILAT